MIKLVYFDLDSMAPHYSVEIRGEPPTQKQILAWDPFVASPETPYLFYVAVCEQDGQYLPVLNVIQTEEIRTIRRTTLKSSGIPIALASGSPNPLQAHDEHSFQNWLLQHEILRASDLYVKPLQMQDVPKESVSQAAFQSYQSSQDDLRVWDQIDELASKGEYATSLLLSEGDIFGEMSVVFDAPRSATLRTLDYCKLFMLEEDALRKLGCEFPWFWERIIALAQQRKATNEEAWQQYQLEMGLDRLSLPSAELLIGARAAQFISYVPSLAHDIVIGLHSSGELVWLWGQEVQAQIFHPSRVHTHDETLMVVDTGNDRVLELDIRSRHILRKWSGPLKQPRSAILTPEGLLLVADEGHQGLVVVDESGREVWQYGLPQEILQPVYAQITPEGHILFVDAGMHRVYELGLNGRTLWTHGRWRNAGIGLDQLNQPS